MISCSAPLYAVVFNYQIREIAVHRETGLEQIIDSGDLQLAAVFCNDLCKAGEHQRRRKVLAGPGCKSGSAFKKAGRDQPFLADQPNIPC